MKKVIAFLSLISIVFSLVSCNFYDLFFRSTDEFDIIATREIVLGKEVDSVVLKTRGGEKITVGYGSDFYDIYGKVGFRFESGKKYSFVAETNLESRGKAYVNINNYRLDYTEFYEAKAKKDGDDAVGSIEEYMYWKQSEDSRESKNYSRFIYKDQKAFVGTEFNKGGSIVYSSEEYPLMPEVGSELNEIYAHTGLIRALANLTSFFKNYESNDTEYDYEQFVTREYKLYENYIVFKQTAPFLNIFTSIEQDPALIYAQISNSNYYITQEAYCNVKTGEIELIKVYGKTLWHMPEYWGRMLEIDMKIYVHDLNQAEYQKKLDNLINYVKTNSDSLEKE